MQDRPVAQWVALVMMRRHKLWTRTGETQRLFHTSHYSTKIVPRRHRGTVDSDKPIAPMSWPFPHIPVLHGTGTSCPMDAAPQAGVDHRYRDLSGLRGQITGDCLYRGSAADGEDSRTRPAARGRGHHAGTGAAGGLTTDADSDINRMGGWPRVVFGRRPSFGES